MNDKLLALRLFVRVARTTSFSAAARELDLSQPSVSRIIAALEKDVGGALVIRTTRAVTLTDVGIDYLALVEAILATLDEADQAARGSQDLRGSLRVAMPASFGVREITGSAAARMEARRGGGPRHVHARPPAEGIGARTRRLPGRGTSS